MLTSGASEHALRNYLTLFLCRDVERHGVELVDGSAAGMMPKELLRLLRLSVANTLYNKLHTVRDEARIDRHSPNLCGHAIRLSESAGGGVRLTSRTNFLAEYFFGTLKHDERRRSGRKNLTQDLEHLPAEAALVDNLGHADYMRLVCGSLDRLSEAFASLDHEQREKHRGGLSADDSQQNLGSALQIARASLSTADRRVVRNEEMDRRVAAAAKSRAPHRRQ